MLGGHGFACFWASCLSLALGIGNVVSINTFNPNMIYSFITVFSSFVRVPFVLKMAVPFVFSEYYVKCHPLIAQQTSHDPDAGHV